MKTYEIALYFLTKGSRDEAEDVAREAACILPSDEVMTNVKEYVAAFESRDIDWTDLQKCHEWKRYIAEEVQLLWPTFTPTQRAALQRQAQTMADAENWD